MKKQRTLADYQESCRRLARFFLDGTLEYAQKADRAECGGNFRRSVLLCLVTANSAHAAAGYLQTVNELGKRRAMRLDVCMGEFHICIGRQWARHWKLTKIPFHQGSERGEILVPLSIYSVFCDDWRDCRGLHDWDHATDIADCALMGNEVWQGFTYPLADFFGVPRDQLLPPRYTEAMGQFFGNRTESANQPEQP